MQASQLFKLLTERCGAKFSVRKVRQGKRWQPRLVARHIEMPDVKRLVQEHRRSLLGVLLGMDREIESLADQAIVVEIAPFQFVRSIPRGYRGDVMSRTRREALRRMTESRVHDERARRRRLDQEFEAELRRRGRFLTR